MCSLAERDEEARVKGVGEKEKECTTECNSQRRLVETAPLALHYGSGKGGDEEKGRKRSSSQPVPKIAREKSTRLGLVALDHTLPFSQRTFLFSRGL